MQSILKNASDPCSDNHTFHPSAAFNPNQQPFPQCTKSSAISIKKFSKCTETKKSEKSVTFKKSEKSAPTNQPHHNEYNNINTNTNNSNNHQINEKLSNEFIESLTKATLRYLQKAWLPLY